MGVTITQVRRALEEFGALPGGKYGHSITSAAQLLASDPTACTLLANSINQPLGATLEVRTDVEFDRQGIRHIERKDCPTPLGEVCRQGQTCCQRKPGR